MDYYQQEISLIKKVLKENPKGMTVSDIARKINVNRNSVAKYLDIMRISGHVELITFGPAKVFFPARRIPILDLLNYTSDYILVYDENFKITMINEPIETNMFPIFSLPRTFLIPVIINIIGNRYAAYPIA